MVVVIESSILISEVERYLRVVEFFRAEGCELRWSAETWIGPRLEAETTLVHAPS